MRLTQDSALVVLCSIDDHLGELDRSGKYSAGNNSGSHCIARFVPGLFSSTNDGAYFSIHHLGFHVRLTKSVLSCSFPSSYNLGRRLHTTGSKRNFPAFKHVIEVGLDVVPLEAVIRLLLTAFGFLVLVKPDESVQLLRRENPCFGMVVLTADSKCMLSYAGLCDC